MKIDIILPYKEVFSSTKASAVSLTVKNSAEFSIYKKQISVYGQLTDLPFDNVKFIEDKWDRSEGGGGITCLLENGSVFDKVGVNCVQVLGPGTIVYFSETIFLPLSVP